jgi:hypothetical protein
VLKKFCINCHLRNKLFLIVTHRFPLVNAAMNAPRAETVLPALAMAQWFTNFPIAKGEQRPLRTCQLVAQMAIKKQEGALTLSEDGGRAKFAKRSPRLSI